MHSLPYDARAGDAVLLVGRLWRGQRSAAVHRSPPPPCACCDWPSRRVVLVLDPENDGDVLACAAAAPPPRPGLAAIQHELAASIMRMIVG